MHEGLLFECGGGGGGWWWCICFSTSCPTYFGRGIPADWLQFGGWPCGGHERWGAHAWSQGFCGFVAHDPFTGCEFHAKTLIYGWQVVAKHSAGFHNCWCHSQKCALFFSISVAAKVGKMTLEAVFFREIESIFLIWHPFTVRKQKHVEGHPPAASKGHSLVVNKNAERFLDRN